MYGSENGKHVNNFHKTQLQLLILPSSATKKKKSKVPKRSDLPLDSPITFEPA